MDKGADRLMRRRNARQTSTDECFRLYVREKFSSRRAIYYNGLSSRAVFYVGFWTVRYKARVLETGNLGSFLLYKNTVRIEILRNKCYSRASTCEPALMANR